MIAHACLIIIACGRGPSSPNGATSQVFTDPNSNRNHPCVDAPRGGIIGGLDIRGNHFGGHPLEAYPTTCRNCASTPSRLRCFHVHGGKNVPLVVHLHQRTDDFSRGQGQGSMVTRQVQDHTLFDRTTRRKRPSTFVHDNVP